MIEQASDEMSMHYVGSDTSRNDSWHKVKFERKRRQNEPRKESYMSIGAKTNIAISVVKDALTRFRRPTVVWSGGKDSTVVLHLVKKVVEESGMKMPPALFIDHGDHFSETFEILDQVSGDWGFNVIYAKNNDALDNVVNGVIPLERLNEANVREARKIGFEGKEFKYSLDSEVGNHLLKTVAMASAVEKYRFDALFTGVRWDENPARSNEVFISSRTRPTHYRVQPILPFMEKDVWKYIFEHKLPIHPKYLEGYRSIDGIHDTTKISELPAWQQNMELTSERSGRSQDKEGMMERLRANGYM